MEGESACCALVGERGAGKTLLLDDLVAAARARGIRVISVQGAESESGLTWSGLHDLCRPLLRRLPALGSHHRAVLEGALALGPPVDADRFAVSVAALHLVSLVADEEPLLIVVDDHQWIDAASREVLAFCTRRLAEDAVAVVLARGDDRELPPGIEVVRLDGLDAAAAGELVASRAGTAVAADVASVLAARTFGNPSALVELARRLTPEELVGISPLRDPLPLGDRGRALLDDELDALPARTLDALRLAALGGLNVSTDVITALVASGLAVADLEPAVDAGLLTRVDDELRFARPFVRAAMHARSTAAELQSAHLALASVLDADRDLERRAGHLVAAAEGPDADVAHVAEQAAIRARDHYAYGSASVLFERSASLSVTLAERARRAGDAAANALAAGAPSRAIHLAESALRDATDVDKARIHQVLARAHHDRGDAGGIIGQLLDHASLAVKATPDLACEMYAEAAVTAAVGLRVDEALEASDRAVELAACLDDHHRSLAETARGAALVVDGRLDAARTHLDRWTNLLERRDLVEVERVLRSLSIVLIWAECFADAAALLDRLAIESRRREMAGVLANVLTSSGILAFTTGDWRRMEEDLTEAQSLAAATGQRSTYLIATATLALFEVHLGRPTAAERIDEAARLAVDRVPTTVRQAIVGARSGLALHAGRPEEAAARLSVLADDERIGTPAPSMWEIDLAEALLAAGDRAAAQCVLASFEQVAVGAGHRRALARAGALRAVMLDDVDEARVVWNGAAAHLSEPRIPFVLGRIELLWGERLLDVGAVREGREHVGAALETFERLGAGPWSARARARLGTTEPSPPAVELDVDERRIVTALQSGRSIEDVATALFLSPRVVEHHLASAIEKLGVESRDDLLLARPTLVQAPAIIVRLLGRFDVRRSDVDLTPPAGMASKAVKILALAGGALHGDELAEVLWPEAAAGRGRARLRNVLNRVRMSCGPVIRRNGEVLSLSDNVEVDVVRFRAAARRALAAGPTDDGEAAAELALSWYGGDLLPDSVYEAWADAPREGLRRDRLALLDLLADRSAARDDLALARERMETAIDADPYDEARYERLASLLLRHDRRAGAAAVLKRAREVLDELGLAPSPRLQQIGEQLTH
jgi:DNA-binding SARP family transcriptional activator/DNA-binding CsgD family transcriptional regulator